MCFVHCCRLRSVPVGCVSNRELVSAMLSCVLVAVLPLAVAQSFPAGVAGVVGDLGARLGEIDGVPGDSSIALRGLASSAAAKSACAAS